MKYRKINLENGDTIVRLEDQSIIIADEQSALDLLMTIAYETGANKVIISKENLTEEFFQLKTKVLSNRVRNFGLR